MVNVNVGSTAGPSLLQLLALLLVLVTSGASPTSATNTVAACSSCRTYAASSFWGFPCSCSSSLSGRSSSVETSVCLEECTPDSLVSVSLPSSQPSLSPCTTASSLDGRSYTFLQPLRALCHGHLRESHQDRAPTTTLDPSSSPGCSLTRRSTHIQAVTEPTSRQGKFLNPAFFRNRQIYFWSSF